MDQVSTGLGFPFYEYIVELSPYIRRVWVAQKVPYSSFEERGVSQPRPVQTPNQTGSRYPL